MEILNALQLKKGKKAEYNRLGNITQPLQFLPAKDKDDDWAARPDDAVGKSTASPKTAAHGD